VPAGQLRCWHCYAAALGVTGASLEYLVRQLETELHRDPFDQLLVAQALSEGIILITADPRVAAYPGPVRRV
jgi:PIN domain nuclease of toxin-antitoxin system